MSLIERAPRLSSFLSAILLVGTPPVAAAPSTSSCPSRTQLETRIRDFVNKLLVEKNPERAYLDFATPDMVQRNQPFGADRSSTIRQWKTMTDRSETRFRVLRVSRHGDVLTIVFRGTLGPGQFAQVWQYDRLRCGKIVEEWAKFEVLKTDDPALTPRN